MFIMCTQDNAIRAHAESPGSGAALWGPLVMLPRNADPADRYKPDAQFAAALQALADDEPLCLSAHGDDNVIGDLEGEGWEWSTAEVAQLLAENINSAQWTGPILIRACAETISNFSARLALALENQNPCFNGLSCYGFNRAVLIEDNYPDPTKLDMRVDLQHTQVVCG